MRNVQEIAPEGSKLVERIFLFWLLTLPFGAKIGAVSVGFLTVYPNLVVGVALFAMVVRSIRSWKKLTLIYFGFLFLWLLYALVYPNLTGIERNADWKFDIRTLGMQLLFAGILFGGYAHMGQKVFLRLIKIGILYFLGVLLVSGVFEYYTGIHLAGRYTDKLLAQEVVDLNYYAPVFIYDNSNDYLVYLLGIIALFLGFREDTSVNRWKTVALLSVGFLFAKTASSRIAILVFAALIILQLILILIEYYRKGGKMNLIVIGTGAVLLALLLVNNVVFTGTKFSTGDYKQDGQYVPFPTTKPFNFQSSEDVRMNLMLNSVDFIKEEPVLGIGPGQFRYRHSQNQVSHSTDTVVGPHNYVLELITQYGIVGWTYLLFLGYVFFRQVMLYWRTKQHFWMLLMLPIFGIISLVPSSFLYMDLNWFIVPIAFLMCQGSMIEEVENE